MNAITWRVYRYKGIRGPPNSKRSIAEWEDPGDLLVDLAPVSPVVQKVHWIAQLVSLTLIRGIAIYPLDSAIQLLNNWGPVVDSLSNAIERAKRAQQSLHYYRK